MKQHILIIPVLGALMAGYAIPSASSSTSTDKSTEDNTFVIKAPFDKFWSVGNWHNFNKTIYFTNKLNIQTIIAIIQAEDN